MITVAAAAIAMKGMNDQNQVTAKAAKSSSDAAAETGLARVQGLLASSKYAALFDDSDWATLIQSDGTPNSETTLGAVLEEHLNSVSSNSGSICSEGSSSGVDSAKLASQKQVLGKLRELATEASAGQVEPINSNSSFRIVSYKVGVEEENKGKIPQGQVIGRLVVEGVSSKGATDAVTRLMVDIPISGKPGTSTFGGSDTVPALWISEGGVDKGTAGDTVDTTGTPAVPKTGEIRGNIVLAGCGSTDLTDAYWRISLPPQG